MGTDQSHNRSFNTIVYPWPKDFVRIQKGYTNKQRRAASTLIEQNQQ